MFDGDDEEPDEGSPAWMATFSDLATLLLTFFVLLLSFANMDTVQFHDLMGSIREAFGVQTETQGRFSARANQPISLSLGQDGTPRVLEQEAYIRRLRRTLAEHGLDELVELEETDRGVALRMRDGVLFPSGSAELRDEAQPLLEEVAVIVSRFTRRVAIEGHTDNRPISTPNFPSNWELSAARSAAVLHHMLRSGLEPDKVQLAGFADTKPVADNGTDEGRARNRRVEFVFLEPKMVQDVDDAEAEPRVRGVRPDAPTVIEAPTAGGEPGGTDGASAGLAGPPGSARGVLASTIPSGPSGGR